MKIVIKPYNGNRKGRLADASVQFTEGFLAGFELIGFAINEDEDGVMFLDLPSYIQKDIKKAFYFLRPDPTRAQELLDKVETLILDCYEKTTKTVTQQTEFVV